MNFLCVGRRDRRIFRNTYDYELVSARVIRVVGKNTALNCDAIDKTRSRHKVCSIKLQQFVSNELGAVIGNVIEVIECEEDIAASGFVVDIVLRVFLEVSHDAICYSHLNCCPIIHSLVVRQE